MTKRSPLSPAGPKPTLSMFDVYSGYVLTQGHNALMYVVMWERVMRFVAIAALVALGAFWLMPGTTETADVLPLKLILTMALATLAIMLFWAARARPQYESQIDLIHCEFRQVMRAASGIERQMLCIPFSEVESLFIRRNRAEPAASCLFMRIRGADEAVLLGISHNEALEAVHRRMSIDLAKARSMAQRQRSAPGNAAAKGAAVAGMQAA